MSTCLCCGANQPDVPEGLFPRFLQAVASLDEGEPLDATLGDLTGFWSGHTVKHVVAAAASYIPLYSLRHRRVVES